MRSARSGNGGVVVTNVEGRDPKRIRWLVALALCFFLGFLGAHRFYVRRPVTGLLMLVTLGGLGIWVLIDFFLILFGYFEDADGQGL